MYILHLRHRHVLGTSIFVFGSLNENGGEEKGGHESDTTLGFVLDGIGPSVDVIPEPLTTLTTQHFSAFNSTALDDGTHQLNMTVSFVGNVTDFFLDYIIYDAGENTTISNKDTSRIFIDDTSQFVQYSSTGWNAEREPQFSSLEPIAATFNDTVTQATAAGASLSLTYWGMSHVQVGLQI